MMQEHGRSNAMPTAEVELVAQVWPEVASWLFVPHTEDEYQRLVVLLDSLIDRVGEDETDPLASLMEVVGCSSNGTKTNMCPNWPEMGYVQC
jgi:HTH-type transcriptional regulator/antitoxin HigA